MTQQGAALQFCNNELIKCLEDLRNRRNELNYQIQIEEEEKNKLQAQIRELSEKLVKTNESVARKIAARVEFDKTITDTESTFAKIVESSQTLLDLLKRESSQLRQRTMPAEPPQL